MNSIGPRSVYDEAKRFAEAIALTSNREHDLDIRIVRIFNAYGPRMRPEYRRAVPAFFKAAFQMRPSDDLTQPKPRRCSVGGPNLIPNRSGAHTSLVKEVLGYWSQPLSPTSPRMQG